MSSKYQFHLGINRSITRECVCTMLSELETGTTLTVPYFTPEGDINLVMDVCGFIRHLDGTKFLKLTNTERRSFILQAKQILENKRISLNISMNNYVAGLKTDNFKPSQVIR